MSSVVEKFSAVQGKIKEAVVSRGGDASVRLVAVSKTQPVEMIKEAYDAGHRHFGENYVQEIVEKSPLMPPDVQWHLIGRLQSDQVGQLIKGCPNLAYLETIDSEELAGAVNKARESSGATERLRVLVHIHTSSEESKSGGVTPAEAMSLCAFIVKECSSLELAGLMTIGAPDYSGCRAEDFETMHQCRKEAAELLGVDPTALELSMGMSRDFETAIKNGSTSVRVGSSIWERVSAKL